MIYTVGQIARDVRVALDMNNSSAALVDEGDIDTLGVEEIIASKIEDAAKRVENDAPSFMLEGGHTFGDSLYWNGDGSGWTLLPEDFMRLIMFRMTDWERPIYHAITEDDEQYQLQSSRFKGIRGTTQKPVCAVVVRPEGLVLEFYSCKDETAEVEQALYQPMPKIDKDGGIDIAERCYRAVVYMTAALVLMALGESEKAQTMAELSKAEIGQ
jgi:hypothetical protein